MKAGRASTWRRFIRQPLAVAGASVAGAIMAISLAAPLLPLPDPATTDLAGRLALPGSDGHLLGTDLLGRDILSRLVWGTRTSLGVALGATLAAAAAGTLVGLVAGYARGRTDWLLMRGVDLLMAFPYLLLALAIVAALGPGLGNALVAIAIVNVPFFARTVRGATLGVARRGFVDAARVGGRRPVGVLFGHVFPNVLPVIVVTMTTTLGWMILETAGLSFLGLGAQPPQADLGSMLGDGRLLLLVKPHLALLPAAVIFVLVAGLNLAGDGLRDALDPRMKFQSGKAT
jgi:peptide/nickel transport system permease protein